MLATSSTCRRASPCAFCIRGRRLLPVLRVIRAGRAWLLHANRVLDVLLVIVAVELFRAVEVCAANDAVVLVRVRHGLSPVTYRMVRACPVPDWSYKGRLYASAG